MKALARFFLKLGFFGRLSLILILFVQLFYAVELSSYLMNLASTIANLLGFIFMVFDAMFVIRLIYVTGREYSIQKKN